jgi:uncharacterized protein
MDRYELGKRSGFRVPRANIGAMRFPKDMDEAVALIHHAIDSGMVYIDTSRGYGDSEIKLGQALKDGYREKVILSTKWSPWIMKVEDSDDTSADCVRKRIEESMRRLDVDYLDYYQLWNIDNREHYEQVIAKGGMLDGILKAKDEGLVGHVGFTTHDTPENLISYLPEIDWCEIVLFSYNLLSRRYEPAIKAYHDAGIGTIVMNPVGGGRLKEANDVLTELARRAGAVSVPDLAMRFLLSNPSVTTAVPGITCKEDVDASVASAHRGAFSSAELQEILRFLQEIGSRQQEFCTSCGYCMPCSEGINIPVVMRLLFDAQYWGFAETARFHYANMKEPNASACVRCGECEPKCTQKLHIMDEMESCELLLGPKAG